MIDGATLPLDSAIFTHVLTDGTNVHIHAGRLRQRLVFNPEFDKHIHYVPVDRALVAQYIFDRVIDTKRVRELMLRHKDPVALSRMEPLIFCQDGGTAEAPDVYHVDGHHRYVMCAAFERTLVPAYVVPFDFWQQYRVTNLPDLTAEELRSLPITKRNY